MSTPVGDLPRYQVHLCTLQCNKRADNNCNTSLFQIILLVVARSLLSWLKHEGDNMKVVSVIPVWAIHLELDSIILRAFSS